jgi:hypothetical protein
VVRALIEPPILAGAADPAQQHAIRLLYGRVLTEPSDIVRRIVRDTFRDATRLFRDLLQAACPSPAPEAFYWRLTCALGDAADAPDWRRAIDETCDFITRGMGEPAPRS